MPNQYFSIHLLPDVGGGSGGGEHVGALLPDLEAPLVVCPHDPVPAMCDQG